MSWQSAAMGPVELFGLVGVPALTCWVSTQLGEAQAALFLVNLLLQCAGFVVVALLPCYATRKMMWVDVAWPWGLFAIGVQLYTHGSGDWGRKAMISSSFVLCGLRMGIGALVLVPLAHRKKKDLPRYDYAKLRWVRKKTFGLSVADMKIEESGGRSATLSVLMLLDVALQAAANSGACIVPGLVLAFDPAPLALLDVACYALFWFALVFESVADGQKMAFIARAKAGGTSRSSLCEVGLWRYSRHPNVSDALAPWQCPVDPTGESCLPSSCICAVFWGVARLDLLRAVCPQQRGPWLHRAGWDSCQRSHRRSPCQPCVPFSHIIPSCRMWQGRPPPVCTRWHY